MDYDEILKLADDIDERCAKNGLEICTYNVINILQQQDMLANPVENRVRQGASRPVFVGGNEPLNVGKLKKIIAELDDDFTIDMRVRTKLTDEQLKDLSYPYPYNTEYTQLEFDDIGYSDKQLCLGCEIANKSA